MQYAQPSPTVIRCGYAYGYVLHSHILVRGVQTTRREARGRITFLNVRLAGERQPAMHGLRIYMWGEDGVIRHIDRRVKRF